MCRLRGHFRDLSLHPSGAFTVEKCFSVSNLSMREVIVSELIDVQSELSKTKQGPHLLRTLDVEGLVVLPLFCTSDYDSKVEISVYVYKTISIMLTIQK